jgi:hypothetical protein
VPLYSHPKKGIDLQDSGLLGMTLYIIFKHSQKKALQPINMTHHYFQEGFSLQQHHFENLLLVSPPQKKTDPISETFVLFGILDDRTKFRNLATSYNILASFSFRICQWSADEHNIFIKEVELCHRWLLMYKNCLLCI